MGKVPLEWTMYREILVTIILPLVGIGFIVAAMIWRQYLSGQKVVDLTADKLGLVLRADAFGLVVLLGFVMTSAGIFFLYHGYESKLKTLQGEKLGLEQAIAELKVYDLRLSLIFPDDNPPNPFKVNVHKAYVQKKGERETKPYELARFDKGFGGIIVNFEKLSLGDKLHVVVEGQDRKWRSDEMVAPAAYLRMYPIPD